MRKIKFRLWDKEKKIMLNVRNIDFEDCYFDTGGMYIDTIEGLDYWDSELYSLMQYTGLHDKNGKEIYENMIINNKYMVIYDFCKFALKNKDNGEIIDFERNKDYEITGEYFK